MTAKQYLNQAYKIDELITTSKEELKRLDALAKSLSSPGISDMPHSNSDNTQAPYTEAVEKLAELELELEKEINHYITLEKEIRAKINAVEDNTYQLILKKRYLLFMKWPEIADELNLTERSIIRKHGAALHVFETIHKKYLDSVSKCP